MLRIIWFSLLLNIFGPCFSASFSFLCIFSTANLLKPDTSNCFIAPARSRLVPEQSWALCSGERSWESCGDLWAAQCPHCCCSVMEIQATASAGRFWPCFALSMAPDRTCAGTESSQGMLQCPWGNRDTLPSNDCLISSGFP